MSKKLLILIFILFSCSPKDNLSLYDLEEIYNFKSKAIAYSLNTKKNYKEFYEFDNSLLNSRNNVLAKCKKFIESNSSKKLKCKIVSTKITNKIETSLN